MSARLGKDEWIDAGLAQLAREGVDAVRVEPLARGLGVTKGSFYWHFKDRPAFLRAMLEAWAERATDAIIADLEETGGPARDRLWALMQLAFATDDRLDRGLRNWSMLDADVAAVLNRIDRRRIAYLEKLFGEIGLSPASATARSWLVYLALLGRATIGSETATGLTPDHGLREVFYLVVTL